MASSRESSRVKTTGRSRWMRRCCRSLSSESTRGASATRSGSGTSGTTAGSTRPRSAASTRTSATTLATKTTTPIRATAEGLTCTMIRDQTAAPAARDTLGRRSASTRRTSSLGARCRSSASTTRPRRSSSTSRTKQCMCPTRCRRSTSHRTSLPGWRGRTRGTSSRACSLAWKKEIARGKEI